MHEFLQKINEYTFFAPNLCKIDTILYRLCNLLSGRGKENRN